MESLLGGLELYVRQWAWLSAVPGKRHKSRWEQHVATTGEPPNMPEIEEGAQVIEYLQEVGPTLPGAMGPEPVTFAEIDAWSRTTGYDPTAWEAQTIRRLSRAFVSQYAKSKETNSPAPWTGDKVDRKAVASGIDKLLGMASKNVKAKK